MESNNSGIAKVDCVHADKENKPKDCLDWLNTHLFHHLHLLAYPT